jgi:hypothetical protein
VADHLGAAIARGNVIADIEGTRTAEADHRHGLAAGRDRLADGLFPVGRPCGRHKGTGTKRGKCCQELAPGESCSKSHLCYKSVGQWQLSDQSSVLQIAACTGCLPTRFTPVDDFPVNSLFLVSETVHRARELAIRTVNCRQRRTDTGGGGAFFPVFSRLSGKLAETGSLQTASTAIKSGLCPESLQGRANSIIFQ